MYQVWIWDEDLLEYVPERRNGSRVEFEHWIDAANDAQEAQSNDGQMRKVEYRSKQGRRR